MAWQPGNDIEIKTERFRLRTLKPADANETYVSWWNDAELQRGFNMPARNWTLGRARQHIARFDQAQKCHLGIYTKGDSALIGFFTILREPENEIATTNICIGKRDLQGGQAALEVKRAMIDFMFREMGVRKVEGRVIGRNLASFAVYHGLKFNPEGVLRKHVRGLEGGRADVYLFGMLRDEWFKENAIGRGQT